METRAPRELTLRALSMGMLIGVVLAVSNIYMGLKLGLWESGGVIASLLAFSGLKALARLRGEVVSPLETNLAQTAATSMGAMPAVVGLMGAMPALVFMGAPPPSWAMALWGLGLGGLGGLVVFMLRWRLLEEESLSFPSGVVTAELISSLHSGGATSRVRTRGLWGASLVAALVMWLREGRKAFPAASFFPGHLGGMSAEQLQLGVGWSPMMWGLGMLVGPQVGLSLLLGALMAWGVLAPWVVRKTWVTSVAYESLVAWLMWPGVGLMVGASLVTLVALGRAVPKLAGDLLRLGREGTAGGGLTGRWEVLVVLPAVLLLLAVGHVAFGLHPLHLVLVLMLLLPLCVVGARAAGQTDISPVSTIGDLQQVSFGALVPVAPTLVVAAGSVASGTMAHTGVGLWSLQAGRLLGASPSRQFHAQLVGVLFGVLVSVPTYALLVEAHGLGSSMLPAPSALQFRAVAEVSVKGLAGLPPSAMLAAGLGVGIGVLLSVCSRGRLAGWLPSATALGIGFLVPAYFAVTLCLASLLAAGLRYARPTSTPAVQVVGSGSIIGESLMGLLFALLGVLGFSG